MYLCNWRTCGTVRCPTRNLIISVLAALSRQSDNKCSEALQVMREVRAELDANPEAYADGRTTILDIVQSSEFICQSLNEGLTPISSTPTGVGDVLSEVTASPTP